MASLLVRFVIALSLAQLGLGLFDLAQCRSRACLAHMERHARNILRIDWKPISVFPNEAKRFR